VIHCTNDRMVLTEMAHGHTYRLFAAVGATTAAAYLGLVFASVLLLEKSGLPHFVQVSMQAVGVLTPIGVAVWWIYKKLRPNYSARTARKGAMAFALFTLVSWGVAFPLSTLSRAALGDWAGSHFFGLISAFVGVATMTALLSLVPCAFMLWIDRHDGEAQAE
jgi:hypothetical protein